MHKAKSNSFLSCFNMYLPGMSSLFHTSNVHMDDMYHGGARSIYSSFDHFLINRRFTPLCLLFSFSHQKFSLATHNTTPRLSSSSSSLSPSNTGTPPNPQAFICAVQQCSHGVREWYHRRAHPGPRNHRSIPVDRHSRSLRCLLCSVWHWS